MRETASSSKLLVQIVSRVKSLIRNPFAVDRHATELELLPNLQIKERCFCLLRTVRHNPAFHGALMNFGKPEQFSFF